MDTIRSLLCSLFLLTLTACVVDVSGELGDDDDDDDSEELCAPTGRSLIDTGVYIAPEAHDGLGHRSAHEAEIGGDGGRGG